MSLLVDGVLMLLPAPAEVEEAVGLCNAGCVSKLTHLRCEPSGMTSDADIRIARSIVDYVFRWFGKKFLTTEQQEAAGILSPEVKARLAAQYTEGATGRVDTLVGAPNLGGCRVSHSWAYGRLPLLALTLQRRQKKPEAARCVTF